MSRSLTIQLIVATLLIVACQPPTEAATGKVNVVATYSILGNFVLNVGGDKIDLRTIVGPGGDAHTFEPSPADGVALAEAGLIFENGLGLEPWLDKLYSSSQSKARRVVMTQGLQWLKDEHGEPDPHIWHDVSNAIRMVEAIRDALIQADRLNMRTYHTNADQYIEKFRSLDVWIFDQVKTLPQTSRKLVTSHNTFGYFARRYGFDVIGTAFGSISTEVADPSAFEVAELVEKIKALRVPAIFAENISNPKLMEQVAAAAGVKLAPTLYTDALGNPGSAGETYLSMMRYNVMTIVEALKP